MHLDPAFGREAGGYKARPVVVVSIDDVHQRTRLVTVVPGTTTPPRAHFRNFIEVLRDSTNNLSEKTYFQCHQIRALDQGRMTAQPIGSLAPRDLRRIEEALRFILGLP
ncbi:MAG TPA: type II toxin-antitoxin system PemK/MazF family toxin, partial [Humisphaera sp.]|nr:type II toxin-antitoxin system PemK/MazF family toxin [Humisphaera sp.]